MDPKVLDFTWKQNRLNKDKEALKAELMGVLNKKPKKDEDKTDTKKAVNGQVNGIAKNDNSASFRKVAEAQRGSEFKSNAQQMFKWARWTRIKI